MKIEWPIEGLAGVLSSLLKNSSLRRRHVLLYSSLTRMSTYEDGGGRFYGNVRAKFVSPQPLELPRIREKLSLNYEPLKRLRYEQFSTLLSSVRDQLTPSSGRFRASLERRSHVSRFAGAGKRGNEFPRENAGIMDTSCVVSVVAQNNTCHLLTTLAIFRILL